MSFRHVFELHIDDDTILSWLHERGVTFVDVWRCPCGECKVSVHFGWGQGAEGHVAVLWAVPSVLLVGANSEEELSTALASQKIKPQLYGIANEEAVRPAVEWMVHERFANALTTYLLAMFPRPKIAEA